MFGVIFLLLIVVPLIELFVIVQVAQGLGALPTIALLLLISTVGAFLVRREGTGVIARIREQLFGGQLPSKDIADGALIMFGGTLLLTPGFVTDAIGLGLLIPPIRAVVRNVLVARFEKAQAARAAAVADQFGAAFQTGGGFPNGGFQTGGFGSRTGAGAAGFGTTGFGQSQRSTDVIDVDVTRAEEPPARQLEPPTDGSH